MIACHKIIEEAKTVPTKSTITNSNGKKINGKTKSLYILLALLLITIALLIAVSIYCYFIKYQVKQKNLLPYHETSIKLKEIGIRNIL